MILDLLNKSSNNEKKKVKEPTSIKEMLNLLMEDDNYRLSNPGGGFTSRDFKFLSEVLAEKEGFYVLFDNGGGKPFDIFKFESEKQVKSFIGQDSVKAYIFAYRIGTADTIKRKIY